jgi:hypothetical protein
MKINLLLSIVFSLSFVSVVDIYAAPLDSKLQDAGAATETKESLIVKIKSKKIVERLDAIHKLAKINNEDSIIVIMEHFKGVPPWLETLDDKQEEKLIIIEELKKNIDKENVKAFFVNVLKEEICSLQKAQQFNMGNKYPQEIFFAALSSFKDIGDIRGILNDASGNKILPTTFRSKILNKIYNYDYITENIDTALNRISPPVEVFIPWPIYNDNNKRVLYGKDREFKDKLAIFSKWAASDAGVKSVASQEFLVQAGMPSVDAILKLFDSGKIKESEKGYYLIIVTNIMNSHYTKGTTVKQEDINLVKKVFYYIEKLDDKGAFCWRSKAGANINRICKELGMKENISLGGSSPAL